MMRFKSAAVALLLAGCGPDLEKACENYVDAWTGCLEEAFADDAEALDAASASLEGSCAVYEDVKGEAADEAAELLDCQAKAISDGDCGDPVAYTGTLLDVAQCNGGLGF